MKKGVCVVEQTSVVGMSGIFAKKLCRLHPAGEGPIYWTDITILTGSVADPGCLSRIPDPYFCPSRIQDPKTAKEKR